MRETNFINQNQKKWKEFEQMLKEKNNDPDKLSELFVQITDDLSYAKTFYPNRSVRFYLNNLAQQVFHILYKRKKTGLQNFKNFWTTDLPKALFDSRKELTISLLVFIVSILIGVFSTIQDPNFTKSILGESYVQMTIENIKSGDPMAVYKKMHQVDMFLGITFNNILVAFRTFILGIFLGIGSITSLLYNGIMLGTFQYFFYEKKLFLDSFLTIWLHGTIEISSIVIAGGAGIKLGSGLIFPGTYMRLQSFKLSAKKGLTIMMGTVPLFIIAGFIESFITRYTEAPVFAKIALILISLLFIVGYFIYLPIKKSSQGLFDHIKEEKLHANQKAKINYREIKSNGDIFSTVFIIYNRIAIKLFSSGLIAAIAYSILVLFITPEYLSEISKIKWFYGAQLMNYENTYGFILATINFALFSWIIYFTNKLFLKEYDPNLKQKNYWVRNMINACILSGFIQGILFLNPALSLLFFCGIFPLLLLINFTSLLENKNFFASFNNGFNYLKEDGGKAFGLFFILLFSCFIYFMLVESPLSFLYFEIINWSVYLQEEEFQKVLIVFRTMISTLGFYMILPLILIGYSILYFSLREIKDAILLKERINNLGVKSSYGK